MTSTPSERSLLLAVVLACLIVGCGKSASLTDASRQVASQLESLTFDRVTQLGAHRCESTLIMTTRNGSGEKVVREDHLLRWDAWDQYQYRIVKGAFTTLDFTIWQGKAFQRQPDGRMRTREDLEEMHYYLRQTWNQWDGALKPFQSVILFEYVGSDALEGRPVDRYKIGFQPQIEPDTTNAARLRQSIEHVSLEGELWMDRNTQAPLKLSFRGEYKLVRFARRPGGAGEASSVTVDYQHKRIQIGRQQLTEPPQVVALP